MSKYAGQLALIVDDFATARRFMSLTLKELGFECQEAGSVEEAMTFINSGQSVNLVLADTHMPEKTGLDLLRDIRGAGHKELPVVLMMMEAFESVLMEGEQLKMSGHIVKPFDAFALSKVLEQVMPKG